MAAPKEISSLETLLIRRRLEPGGWPFFRSEQASVEATCLAILAVGATAHGSGVSESRFLMNCQLSDGSWPSFSGDTEGTWTTGLAISTLISLNAMSSSSDKALNWLVRERGKEGDWFWRWKFKIADREVRFDPDKYGWPWRPGSASWVIPRPSAWWPSNNSLSAIGLRRRRTEFAWVSICFWIESAWRRLEFRKQRRLRSTASGPRGGHRNRIYWRCRTRNGRR